MRRCCRRKRSLAADALDGGSQGYAWFTAKLDDCCFANRTGKEATEENRAKEFGEYATWALGVDGESVAGDAEMWELDEPAPPKASKFRQSMGTPKPKLGEEATELQIGALRNCYLVRGGGVDVYKNTEDGLEDEGVTLKLRDAGGDAFTPQKALLARGERNLLLLTPTTGTPGGRAHNVFQYDIERETVVSGWKCQKDEVDIPMADICTDSKEAQLTTDSTFMGLDDNRLVRWDMRAREGAVGDLASPVLTYAAGKDFARGTGFTCMATTGAGDVVVGGRDGKVRLYSASSLTQAKTSFPGIGAPITHIDVSYDGKWILATTDGYLMVLSTTFRDKDGKVSTGFRKRMGSNVAAPRLLRLLPADVARTRSAPFSKARFAWITTGDAQERWVSATVGTFTAVWNFRHVKTVTAPGTGQTQCFDYNLIAKTDRVVDAGFMHANFARGSGLVVATALGEVDAFAGEDDEE